MLMIGYLHGTEYSARLRTIAETAEGHLVIFERQVYEATSGDSPSHTFIVT